jgi:ABC-type phosphate/phosphonate transport system permease subunit
MILGRPTQFWYSLVTTIAAAIVATASAAGVAVNLEMVAADLAVASALIALIANKAVTGSLLGARK